MLRLNIHVRVVLRVDYIKPNSYNKWDAESSVHIWLWHHYYRETKLGKTRLEVITSYLMCMLTNMYSFYKLTEDIYIMYLLSLNRCRSQA